MAQSIILKRSAQAGKTPDTASLNLGELAINTYDGKVFLKKSGSIESIQTLVTTDSVTTGSVSLTGDLTVQGAINARQFNINVISSSVIYQSGSTKFGDSVDDVMSVTGSVLITGSISASTFIGIGNLTSFSSSVDSRIALAAGGGGANTFDFNSTASAGLVNYLDDGTSNTTIVANLNSADVVIGGVDYLSVTSTLISSSLPISASYFIGDGSRLTGLTGTGGAQGSQGPTGPQGLTGPQGNQGPTGNQGNVGPQGNQGPTGNQGNVGPQGNQGPTGAQGFQGVAGVYTISTKTANYTETSTSGSIVLLGDTTGGAFTITLPSATLNTADIKIKKIAGTPSLVVSGSTGQTIDGGLSAALTKVYESIGLVASGSNWYIV